MRGYEKLCDNLVEERFERRNEFYSSVLFVSTLIFILVTVCIIKLSFISIIQVSGPSMQTTLSSGDLLIAKNYSKIKREDIIVFYSDKAEKTLIKRVIALPGETVWTAGEYVYVSYTDKNGDYVEERLEEDYLTIRKGTVIPKTYVPDGYLFVLGDNRSNSTDSRTLGPISVDCVNGVILKASLALKDTWVTYFYKYL